MAAWPSRLTTSSAGSGTRWSNSSSTRRSDGSSIDPQAPQRDVAVQGLVLLAARGLDGRHDLAGDAQLGEGPERRLAVAEVADGLEQADHALLLDVVGVAAGEEVAPGLGPGEAAVAVQQQVEGLDVTLVEEAHQHLVREVGGGGAGLGHPGSWLLRAAVSD